MVRHPNPWIATQIVEHQRRIWRERETLGMCRHAAIVVHTMYRHAVDRNDAALARAAYLDRKLTQLASRAVKRPAITRKDDELLRMLGALDQAEAAALEILEADAGPRFDTLAELLGRIVQDLHDGIAGILDERQHV